ncbi:AAA family ATPase [candidate division KSB3 bacterium]|nr:AAA family ATPase [candidate division KSB3 bacterium]
MDPILNPFSPGAGTRPPELAGRDELRETMRVAVERVRRGLPTKSVLMVGLRGVGKTVLLDRMRDDAESSGIQTMHVEAPEARSLPALLSPELRVALLRLSRNEAGTEMAFRALRGLAGFAKALKLKYNDIGVGFDFEPEPGLADNGDLEHDLPALLDTVGTAARDAGTALILFIDELQYVREPELAALITALHRMAQRGLPVALVGAGLGLCFRAESVRRLDTPAEARSLSAAAVCWRCAGRPARTRMRAGHGIGRQSGCR